MRLKLRPAVSGFVLVALLAGCATASRQSWTKPDADAEQLARDRYTCMQESRTSFQTQGGASPTSSPSRSRRACARPSCSGSRGTGST